MELQCSCTTARRFEKIAQALVKQDIAWIESQKVEREDEKDPNSPVRTRVCRYEIAVGDWGETTIFVRWWEDRIHDRASIQMSHEAFDALLESTTVMSLMMQLGQKVSKNGHGVNVNDLKNLLMKAIEKEGGIKDEKIDVVM